MKSRIITVLFFATGLLILSSCASQQQALLNGRHEFAVTQSPAVPHDLNPGNLIGNVSESVNDPEQMTMSREAQIAMAVQQLRPSFGSLMATTDNKIALKLIEKSNKHLERVATANYYEDAGFFQKMRNKMFGKIAAKKIEHLLSKSAMSQEDIFAIVSLSAGILAWIAYYGSLLFGLLAIIMGYLAISRGTTRKSIAIAGIILGAVGWILWLLLIIF